MTLSDDRFTIASVLGSATIHEAAGRIGALPPAILPADPTWQIAGPAYPVRCPPGDNLWLHRALYAAEPQDVLVVETGDTEPEWGYWGEILSTAAKTRRLGGLVLQGGSRDHAHLPTVDFPVFSLGRCIRGTIKDRELDHGRLGEPIEIGGVAITAGDLVVGDVDGVVVIPEADAEAVIEGGEERELAERAAMERIRGGETTLSLFGLED
ncbi:MAG: 4-hydroxy-4-methyl-2-oxoglutarate aldolase [Actinomycetota bacterium]